MSKELMRTYRRLRNGAERRKVHAICSMYPNSELPECRFGTTPAQDARFLLTRDLAAVTCGRCLRAIAKAVPAEPVTHTRLDLWVLRLALGVAIHENVFNLTEKEHAEVLHRQFTEELERRGGYP